MPSHLKTISYKIRGKIHRHHQGLVGPNLDRFLINQCNQTFKRIDITIVFFKNNLPILKVNDRYRIIKECHESAIRGHKRITKTYDRLAHEYYWRNMQSDVRQFVWACPDC